LHCRALLTTVHIFAITALLNAIQVTIEVLKALFSNVRLLSRGDKKTHHFACSIFFDGGLDEAFVAAETHHALEDILDALQISLAEIIAKQEPEQTLHIRVPVRVFKVSDCGICLVGHVDRSIYRFLDEGPILARLVDAIAPEDSSRPGKADGEKGQIGTHGR
jgi:hypothetical protein